MNDIIKVSPTGERLYRVAYTMRLQDPGFTKQQLMEANMGGCDALVIVSILRGSDNLEPFQGEKSWRVGSCDGRHGVEVPTGEYFQALSTLADYILECCPDATNAMKKSCQNVIDDHRRMIGLKRQPDGSWKR